MEGRKYRDENYDYRYGFNGKEDDKDFGDKQLIQDYGFRLYNPTIARFLSVDPLAPSYPMLTPYQFASNRPIDGIDLDGLEYAFYIRSPDVSRKMRGATSFISHKQSDIYRQREISYWALNHMYDTDYMLRIKGKDIQVAELEYDPDKYAPGVTVYLYKWTNDKQEDTQISGTIYVPPNGSSEMIHNSSYDFSFPKSLRRKPIDAYYPVDVKLLDGTYDDHDFIGSYNEFGAGLFYGRYSGLRS